MRTPNSTMTRGSWSSSDTLSSPSSPRKALPLHRERVEIWVRSILLPEQHLVSAIRRYLKYNRSSLGAYTRPIRHPWIVRLVLAHGVSSCIRMAAYHVFVRISSSTYKSALLIPPFCGVTFLLEASRAITCTVLPALFLNMITCVACGGFLPTHMTTYLMLIEQTIYTL